MLHHLIFLKSSFAEFQNSSKTKIYILAILLLLIVFYLYRFYQTINNNFKLLLVLATVGCLFGIFIIANENIIFNSLLKNYNITTGTVESYFRSKSKGYKGQSTNRVSYRYRVENVDFVNSYYENSYVEIPDKKPDLLLHYLILYDKNKPTNSYILFNYPIASNQDFKNYQILFKESLPPNVFKNY